jgi:hypothetical protein
MAVTTDRARSVRIFTENTRDILADVRAADEALRASGEPTGLPHDLVWTRTQLEAERLARWYVDGELTPEQEKEWVALFAEIAEAMPAIRRLGLGEFRWPEGHPPLPGDSRPKAGRAPCL